MRETHILTADQMRLAEQTTIDAGVSEFTLMERAGHAVAVAVLEHMPDYGRVVIVAGPGNNGGDGFAAAYFLRQRRVPVTVVTLVSVEALTGHAKAYADKARDAGVKIRESCSEHCFAELGRWLLRAVMVVDAVLGTGLNRALEGRMREVVERINQTDRPILSIDIASGVCSDTGAVPGVAVRADFTLPIAATKWGHWLNAGRDYTGTMLEVADIGVSDASIREAWLQSCAHTGEKDSFCVGSAAVIHDGFLNIAWPHRCRLSHKGSYGHVWIFGGSVGLTGAPQLAALGAYAGGAGLASIVCPDDVWPVIASANMEVMVHPESKADWHAADAV
ncbi:MAG: NAD(P)H-hydrate epimerase, partial [Mariprofundus sp.]